MHLDPLKKVDISKPFHLLHIHRFHHFLIVEQYPSFLSFAREVLPDEGDVVAV